MSEDEDDLPISQIMGTDEWRRKERSKANRKTAIPIYLEEKTYRIVWPIILMITIFGCFGLFLSLIALGQYIHCKIEDKDQTISQCFWLEEHIDHELKRKRTPSHK